MLLTRLIYIFGVGVFVVFLFSLLIDFKESLLRRCFVYDRAPNWLKVLTWRALLIRLKGFFTFFVAKGRNAPFTKSVGKPLQMPTVLFSIEDRTLFVRPIVGPIYLSFDYIPFRKTCALRYCNQNVLFSSYKMSVTDCRSFAGTLSGWT